MTDLKEFSLGQEEREGLVIAVRKSLSRGRRGEARRGIDRVSADPEPSSAKAR